jgi:predicted MFS family arabinose efflux permease
MSDAYLRSVSHPETTLKKRSFFWRSSVTNRSVVLSLSLASMLGVLAMMAMNPFLPVIADDLGTSVSVVGQINTAVFIIGASVGLLIGPMADHYGLRRVIVLAAILLALAAFLTAVSTGYWMLLLSRIPAGLGVMAAVSVAIASTRLPESERRRGIGWVASASAFAAIIGVPVLTLIAYYSSWRVSFVVFGLIVLATASLLWRFVPEDPPIPSTRFQAGSVISAYIPILTHKPSIFTFLADILRGVTWFTLLIYLASYFVEGLGLTLRDFAAFMMLGGICYFAGTRFGDGRLSWISLGALFYSSTAIMALAGVAAFSGIPGIGLTMALLLVYAFMGGVGFPAITIMVTEISPAGRGTTMMLRTAGMAGSQALGAAIGGVLLAAGGYALLGLGLFGFGCLATVAVLLAKRSAAPAPVEPAVGGN